MTTRQDTPPNAVFTQVRVEKVAEKVAVQLRRLIADGVFKAGDRLPSERELTERMGVGRTSVREALQHLEMQGILETVHGGGSIVKNITEQEIRKPLELFLEEDKRKVLELAELRAFMEAWAARAAATHCTREELDRIRGYLEEMERDFEKGQIRYEVDVQYHTALAAATHNMIYLHLIGSIYQLISYSVKVHREEVFTSRESQRTILEHHRKIFNAIQKGDPDAAEAAMKEHLALVVQEFTRKFFPG